MTTIKDIAQQAGVSCAAVSYALSGSRKVSSDTRERILKIASELNYVPNINARILKSGKTMRVGLLLQFFSGSFYLYLVESLFQALRLQGYNLEIHILSGPENMLISDLAAISADAAVVHLPKLSERGQELMVRTMQPRHIPLVFTESDRVYQNSSCVITDNVNGMSAVVEYLIKSGHKKIAYLGGKTLFDEKQRYLAYRKTLDKYGLSTWCEWNYLEEDPNEWAGYQCIRSLYPTLSSLPDAICCSTDTLALGCIRALESFGLNIPHDISVTGFDNLYPAQLSKIKLTTVQNPISRVAQISAQEAVRLMKPGEEGRLTVVKTELIQGNSTALQRS